MENQFLEVILDMAVICLICTIRYSSDTKSPTQSSTQSDTHLIQTDGAYRNVDSQLTAKSD